MDVTFETFTKRYFLEVVFRAGGLFDLITAEAIVPRHRAQTLHYLLVAGLGPAKLVNVRMGLVEHEFGNTTLRLEDRRGFVIPTDRQDPLMGSWCSYGRGTENANLPGCVVRPSATQN